jgi:hypothetical protein
MMNDVDTLEMNVGQRDNQRRKRRKKYPYAEEI